MRECKQNNNHKIAKIFLEAGIAIGNGWNQFHFPTDLIYMLIRHFVNSFALL